MYRWKQLLLASVFLFFLLFSFYPTIFELNNKHNVKDPAREFILEHNYYWPDYNLYLSKIRQGHEGTWFPREKYTTEPHSGSLIQIFYTLLGHLGATLGTDPNGSYLLGRVVLAPLLLFIVYTISSFYFSSYIWRMIGFVIAIVSGSFPKFVANTDGSLHVVRHMEWWSNIDALQRITFIPHILFGQVGSFYLLYQLTMKPFLFSPQRFLILAILGNAVGLIFPPSLITLNSVLLMIIILQFLFIHTIKKSSLSPSPIVLMLFIICTIPSLLYLYAITQQIPWSALVQFHRTHPMLIPFQEYLLGTGPILILAIAGSITALIKKERRVIAPFFWILSTFFFAILFTHVQEQSPLRFTQTGLFIPLGILGTYFLHTVWENISGIDSPGRVPNGIPASLQVRKLFSGVFCALLFFYIAGSLFMMKNSLDWQTTWISQRLGANIPPVPYPPQAMYPLREWAEGIRWLSYNSNNNDIVLADITAGNYIPAYAGNTVYFGQANTVDYERKHQEVMRFYKGEMPQHQAELFLKNNSIRYVFYSIQERDEAEGKPLPILEDKTIAYQNPTVTVYKLY